MRNVTEALDAEQAVPILDIEPIKTLHRDPEGWVGFVRKPRHPRLDKNGRPRLFENIGAIQVRELDTLLPGIFENWLQQDSYMTVNSYYRGAHWTNELTGLPDVWRKEKFLKQLCSCYVDLDCGRPDSCLPQQRITWRDAMAVVGNYMDDGIIPPASIFARSGRGLYIFWLLRDEKNETLPPRSWPENINLYKQVNRCLGERLKKVAADLNVVDAARVVRVPGSEHSTAQRVVQYLAQFDQWKRPFLYTLPELAGFFQLNTVQKSLPESTRDTALPPQIRTTKNRGSAPGRKNGFIARAAQRAHDIQTIEHARGGIDRGFRRRTLTMYGEFLRDAGTSPEDIDQALETMAANCNPPYPSDKDDPPLDNILTSVGNSPPRPWSNKKLCSYFQITPELARELNLLTIVPKEVAEERKLSPGKRRKKLNLRRGLIQEIIEERNGLPEGGVRGLAKILSDYGLSVSRETVRKDILTSPYAYLVKRPGRPKENGEQPPLILVSDGSELSRH